MSEDNERISNLMTINDNNIKNKNDLNAMIENLKNTIEIMKKNNTNFDEERDTFKTKYEQILNDNENLTYDIENIKNNLDSIQKDKEYIQNEVKVYQDDIRNKEMYIKDLQENYKILLSDMDKYKTKIEIANYNNQEKEHTIENLKTSLNFITETLQDYKTELEKLKNKHEIETSEKLKFSKNLDLNEKKMRDSQHLIETLLLSKDECINLNINELF